jgi:alkylation response protein AidB-like acyl-CoA dehydrogenase
MTYAAPLNDMRFVLNRLAGLPEIATLPGFEDADPELVEAILIEAGRFASEVLAPLNSTGDRQGCRWFDGKVATPDGFPAAYQQFIEGGWHSMPASTDIGGQGMPALVSGESGEFNHAAMRLARYSSSQPAVLRRRRMESLPGALRVRL